MVGSLSHLNILSAILGLLTPFQVPGLPVGAGLGWEGQEGENVESISWRTCESFAFGTDMVT